MTGLELRELVEQQMTVTAFTQRVAAAYVRDHNVNERSAVRHVKRWFAEDHASEDFWPRGDWRRAVREVLGFDPFRGSSPLTDLERRLEELAAAVAEMNRIRNELIGEHEERLQVLERRLERREAEPTRPQVRS